MLRKCHHKKAMKWIREAGQGREESKKSAIAGKVLLDLAGKQLKSVIYTPEFILTGGQ